jgi:hypothetical protein
MKAVEIATRELAKHPALSNYHLKKAALAAGN